MDAEIWRAIERGLTCDITTIGRKSGQARRVEIWYFVIEERVYITGTPGKRDWYANILANPDMVMHVKQGAQADLAAWAAIPITVEDERRRIMGEVIRRNSWFRSEGSQLEEWVAGSPLIALDFRNSPLSLPEYELRFTM